MYGLIVDCLWCPSASVSQHGMNDAVFLAAGLHWSMKNSEANE